MKTLTAKLYPTKEQELRFTETLECCSLLYNQALDHRRKAWSRRGESVGYFEQSKCLTRWRKTPRFSSLPVEIARDALRRVDWAMKAFFKRVKKGESPGFPRFKKKGRIRSFSSRVRHQVAKRGCVFIPGVGDVKCRGLAEPPGMSKFISVIRRASGWHVRVAVETPDPPKKREFRKCIGIDLGLTHFFTLSDGRQQQNPMWFRCGERRLRKLQTQLSRCTPGSNRHAKAAARVSLHHESVVAKRRDFVHKTARCLVDEFDLIGVEKLSIKGMAKSWLSKSVRDVAWYSFTSELENKAESAGSTIVKVDPRGTTSSCSACGSDVPKKLSERVHDCGNCGYKADRDVNAAMNVLLRVTEEVTLAESAVVDGVERCRARLNETRSHLA